ncbi:PQQ-binding-like beta-propeller repeat protein [Ereboglobus luteus]|uniref:Uncharacterized protein n=1 Tax=Ereboglobus luteus TaxID=1796921 RepID=A0A2U8E4L8_9BACT|nr:PQQ-binding-like beta-propeller repeat protein [Ereboglobus luteus]AWI09494.1 hypothetical protein CKA38_09770 [Ereboglobus luteus]
MSLRAFTFSDGISNKYWYLQISGSSFSTLTGKIGGSAAGKLETKTFPSSEVCEKEAAALVAQRVRKGFEEVTDAGALADAASAFQSVASAPPAPAAAPQSVLSRPSLGIQDQDVRKFLRLCGKGDIEAVRCFLKEGLDPDAATEWGHAYDEAIKNGHEEIVRLFTPLIKTFAFQGSGHIETAAGRGDAMVRVMIDSGHDVARDPHVIKILPHVGAELAVEIIGRAGLDLKSAACEHLLCRAIVAKNRPFADWLLGHGAQCSSIDPQSGLGVMHAALELYGHDLDFVRRLVGAGAKVSAISRGHHGGGLTAIEHARGKMSAEVEHFAAAHDDGEIPPEDLFRAARHGGTHLIERYLSRPFSKINVRDSAGRTLLHHACFTEHESDAIIVAMFLIKRGIDANARDSLGRNALFYYNFTSSGTPSALGKQINAFLGVDNFHNAVLAGVSSIMWKDLREAAGYKEPASPGERFKQWLSGAIGDRDMLTLILKKAGADVDCADNEGMTPLLFHARHEPQIDGLDAPCDASPNAMARDPHMRRYHALWSLLRAGADVTRRYRDNGATALHCVQSSDIFEKEKLHQLFRRLGADVDARDANGRTPLHYAALCVSEEQFMDLHTEDAIEDLVTHGGADPNIGDNDGNTPLHLALRNPRVGRYASRALLKHGANPFAKNKTGRTPEDIMVELDVRKGYDEAIREYVAKSRAPGDVAIAWSPVPIAGKPDAPASQLALRAALALGKYDIDYITALAPDRIFVIGLHDQAHCINSLTGEILWRHAGMHYPVMHGGTLYCGLDDKRFGALDPATGAELWSVGVGSEVRTPVQIHEGRLAIFSAGRAVVAVDIAARAQHWKLTQDERAPDQILLWKNQAVFISPKLGEDMLCYVDIASGAKTDEQSVNIHDSPMLLVGDTAWALLYQELHRLDLGTGKCLPTGHEFEDDSRWRDYSVRRVMHHDGKLYIFTSLQPRQKDADGNREKNTYRLCVIDGNKALTVTDCESDGAVAIAGDKFIHLSHADRRLGVYNLNTKAWAHWHFPWFTGSDEVERHMHISDGCIFVSQKGGDKHAERDLLYVIG